MFTMSLATALSFVTAVVIPALSALLAKGYLPRQVAGLLTLLLAAASGLISEAVTAGATYNWKHGLLTALGAYVVAVLAHYGLVKDTTVEAKLLAVGNKPAPAVGAAEQGGV